MLSSHSLELKENLSSKRKSECSTPPPPSKQPRTEIANIEATTDKEQLDTIFNSYLYWKDPLPDISSELNGIECPMLSE